MSLVGIIGVGEIGWRMGKLLSAAGHSVSCFDISTKAMQRAAASGFRCEHSSADVGAIADIVITCVTDGAAVRDVVAELLRTPQAGTPLIDTTSAEPWITLELARQLAAKGIPFLDAPISGGVPAADRGEMNFMIGGDAALIERCRPILACLGTVITRAGDIGTGHSVKAINMLALASSMLATTEILAIGLHHGGSLGTLVEMLQASSGASYSTKIHFPRFIVPGNYSSNFTFDLMLKDLGIGIGLADSLNIPLFVQRDTYELYRASSRLGLVGKDNTRIVQGILPAGAKHGDPDESVLRRLEIAAAACNRVVAAESLCLGAAAGVNPATVQSILSAGSADSEALRSILAGNNDKTGTLLSAWDALCAASADADRWRLPVPLLRQVAAIHASAMERFGPEADDRAVLHLMAEWTGQSSHFDRRGEFS